MMAGLEQRLEAGVEFVETGEGGKNGLVDPQGCGGEAAAGFEFDQVESTEGSRWRERAPVRIVEQCESEGEGDGSAAVVAPETESFAALRGEGRVHLDACAEEEN